MTYCCFTKIKYTLDLIYLFCIITHVMCTWAAQKHSWELAFELYFYQCIFLVVAVSWGDDLYLSLESELILGNQCCHLKQVLQHYWDPLPVSSLSASFSHSSTFLVLKYDGGFTWGWWEDSVWADFQAEVILLHMLGSWSNSWQLPCCYRKRGKL